MCTDLSEEAHLAYLKRRNARQMRLQLANDAMTLDHKLAFLMASHPRLGRHSPAHVLRQDMRLWIKICSDVEERMRTELMIKLFDQNWDSELYLSHAEAQWKHIVEEPIGACMHCLSNPLHAVQTVVHSDSFNWIVVAASVLNTAMLMLEHERNSFPGKMWPSDNAFALFHASLRVCSITVSATYALEFLLVLLAEGPLFYFTNIWHFLDGAIALVCIFLLPVEVREFQCLSQPDELLVINACYRGEDGIWSLARSWRLVSVFIYICVVCIK